ncbi:MAG: PKD domain-containing protein, partial [Flavobacteriales bacterium]|nr:PKD domain-containing protein [Flavobacteriales bacterium]
MKKLLFVLILIVFGAIKQASATHIVGGELVYRHLGGSQYAVTLIIYRDCLSGQAAFDNPASIGVFRSNGTLVQTLSFALDSVVTLQSTINSSCVTAPNNVCTEAGYYTDIVTLPPVVGGYTLSYQRCCRNAVIQNIQTPGDVGATYVATIPGSESSPNNSSPYWNNLPPLYVCANLPWQFNHSAFDADGDSLVYSLCTPYQGASTTAPQPSPPSTPPYLPILWEPPYGPSDMMGGTVPLTINPSTGQINATPNAQGTYVIGLCVREYRNGVLLGETARGIQVNVVNCQAPVAMPDDLNEILPNSFINCTELVQFNASNSSGFNISWNFGDPTTTLDQSTLQNPSWTYPGPGTYDLTLIVFNPTNPNDPLCTDTVIQQVLVQDTVIPDAGPDVATCPGISVQIGAPAIQGWTYHWLPTTGLSNPNIAQPTASITQQITYTLTATDAVGCSGSDAVTVSLLANAAANAGSDVQICPGATTQLQASGGVTYLWSPNQFINNVNVENPNVNPQTTTSYIVEVTNLDGCIGFDTVKVSVLTPTVFVSNDTTICFGDSIQLVASGASTYSWAPATEISNPAIGNPEVYPSTTTTYVLTALDGNACQVMDSVLIAVQSLPTANAGQDQSICLGEEAQLNGTGGTNYSWSPSGGLNNASIANPLAMPTSTTNYEVTVSDNLGCSDADSVTITVNPLPTVNAGADATLCLGQTVQLNSTGADTYVWTPATGLSNPNIFNPTAEPSIPTEYVVEGTDANGCSNTDTVLVDVFEINAIGDTIICIGDQAQIGVIGGVSWTWTPTTGLSNPNAQFPTATPTSTTVYTVTGDDGTGCFASDTVTVAVSPLPTAFAGFDQGVCAGSNAQLNATGGVTYSWSPTTGLSNSNIPNPV